MSTAKPALLVGSEWLPNAAGGLNRYFYGLAHAVARAGVPARAVVTYLKDGQSGPIPLDAMAAEGASLLARLRGVRQRALRAIRAGFSLANPHFALYAFPWIGASRNVPLVVTFHGPWAAELRVGNVGPNILLKAWLARLVETAVYRRARRCIVLSEAFAGVLQHGYAVARDRIAVVPGGVELEPFWAAPGRKEARDRMRWPQDRSIVLSVRRLARRMGLELLIDAAERLRRSCPGALVLIAGSGPLAGELQRRIHSAGLEDTVHLLGFVPEEELPLAYAAADITVLPSIALEGFGLTIVESLASGTPAICTPVGGMPEVVGPLDAELLTRGVSAEAIADRLTTVLTGRQPVPDAATCRAYAGRFGWDVVFPRILGVWRQAGAEL